MRNEQKTPGVVFSGVLRKSTTGVLLMAISILGAQSDPMRAVAERYVKLVLAVGQHDAD